MTREPEPGKNARGSMLPEGRGRGNFPADETVYVREDWVDFRDPARISARAGVPRALLPRVVVKELADNAIDAAGDAEFRIVARGAGQFRLVVSDTGSGIPGTDAELAARFSIRRPMESSKTRRMPTRGMLGNGTRVVAGVVLLSGGTLDLFTRGRRLTLRPREDGRTDVVRSEPWEGTGTRIEVTFGPDHGVAADAAGDGDLFAWARLAKALRAGPGYKGRSSPWWYGPGAFWELLQAAGDTPLAREVERLDGCTSRARTAEVAGAWGKRAAASLSRDEAREVLDRARAAAAPVNPERLGKVGRRDEFFGYSVLRGSFEADGAVIPFAVEAWANRADDADVQVCVNRTPVLGQVSLWRAQSGRYVLDGCGLDHELVEVPSKRAGEFVVQLNVIAPFVPLMSSGKDPDLSPVTRALVECVEKAVRSAQANSRPADGDRQSQKELIVSLLPEAAARLSGGGCWFSLRQLFYDLRPRLIRLLGREPNYGTFSKVVGRYEDEHGDVEGLYRDDRGVLCVPHTRERVQVGTRAVAAFRRPEWTFNRVLYSEKEGLFPLLERAGFPERWDCALLTAKGYATRAISTLLRRLAGTGEPLVLFAIHDADGPGTQIFASLERALRGAGVTIVNLGLEPAEARDMGLQVEPVRRKGGKRVPVAGYVPRAEREWLQRNRVELNAMSTPQLLAWLDAKFAGHAGGKVIPPREALVGRLTADARRVLTDRLVADAVRRANVADRVERLLEQLQDTIEARADQLVGTLPGSLAGTRLHWSAPVTEAATEVGAAALEASGFGSGG